jgi:hypothetical protein
MAVVSHCAGPFSATSAQMIDACFANRAHYIDITGQLARVIKRLPGRRPRRIWRAPTLSIQAAPALQSHTADEQKATEKHAPLPGIETEKPAIGHSYKSHGRPLSKTAARRPARALESAVAVTERANTGTFKHASGFTIVAKEHFAFC